MDEASYRPRERDHDEVARPCYWVALQITLSRMSLIALRW